MSSTLFIAATILAVVFTFIILFIYHHRKGHNKKVANQEVVLADVVWRHKLEITEKETINNRLIAIDKLNFVLLYINFNHLKEEVALIDLSEVKSVKVSSEQNSVYEQRKGRTVLVDNQLGSVQFEVALVDGRSKNNLTLFEYKDGIQDVVHIKRRADYWSHLINQSITELPHPRGKIKNVLKDYYLRQL